VTAGAARTPRYALVAQVLLGEIENGRYQEGDMLPTELDLCRRFDVSRITVRAAVRELELRGMVSRRAGVGTRVESFSRRDRFVHGADSVEDFVRALVPLKFVTLSTRRIAADEVLAAEIDCARGQALARVDALRVDLQGVPRILSVHFVPEVYALGIPRMDGRTGSFATLLARAAGEEVAEIRQAIEAHNLSAVEARHLKGLARDAALQTRRRYLTSTGRLLLASRSLYPKGKFSFETRMRRERGAGR